MQTRSIEFQHEDERGWFKQIVSGKWEQMNIFLTKKGHQRGGHYHKNTTECFYVIDGEIELEVNNVATGEYSTHKSRTGGCFVVEPYESHTVTALADTIIVVLLSKKFNPKDTDIFEK